VSQPSQVSQVIPPIPMIPVIPMIPKIFFIFIPLRKMLGFVLWFSVFDVPLHGFLGVRR
jgi:hypothetical protein